MINLIKKLELKYPNPQFWSFSSIKGAGTCNIMCASNGALSVAMAISVLLPSHLTSWWRQVALFQLLCRCQSPWYHVWRHVWCQVAPSVIMAMSVFLASCVAPYVASSGALSWYGGVSFSGIICNIMHTLRGALSVAMAMSVFLASCVASCVASSGSLGW